MARSHALGRRGETLAAWLVRLRGGRVLSRNTRVRGACEVDIVARYGRTLAVIEVKARRGGGAAEAVGPERVAGLSRAAQWLAESRGYESGRSASISSRSRARAFVISQTRSTCDIYVAL